MSDNKKHVTPVPPRKTYGACVSAIAPGDACWIGEIECVVNQVCVRDGGPSGYSVQYQVVWWSGRERRCEWVDEHEVKPISPNGPFLKIGFSAT